MRRATWLSVTLLLASVPKQLKAEEPPSDPAPSRWTLFGKKTPAPKDELKAKDISPDVPSVAQARLAAAKATYFERLKVCNRLREVALQNNDDELLRRAEQLEIRVWDCYQNQMKRFASAGSALSPEEQVFNNRLSTDTGRSARPAAGAPTASRRD